jgi:hypothetical protein
MPLLMEALASKIGPITEVGSSILEIRSDRETGRAKTKKMSHGKNLKKRRWVLVP